MHLLLLYCFFFHPHPDTSTIPVNWNNTTHWKIYTLNNSKKVFNISADSLSDLKGGPMGDDSMHVLLATSKILHVPMSPAWMGCYLASCVNEKGQLMKIVVSVYGGFFLNEFDGNYYQLDPDLTPTWLDYMRRAYIKTE